MTDTQKGPSEVTTTQRAKATLAGAVHSNCNCLKCRLGNAAWNRDRRAAIRAGQWQPWADAAPVRAHIEQLHADGMPYELVARLADVDPIQIRRIRGTAGTAPVAKLRTDTATALLGVRLNFAQLPPGTLVPARGTARRVQALRAIGWPSYAIADLSGLGERTVYEALLNTVVRIETHRAIADVYDVYHDQDPAQHGVTTPMIRRGRRHAARHHWAVPQAWSDIDTDLAPNPKIRAVILDHGHAGDRSRAVIEDTLLLAAHRVPRDEIARRIGMSWNGIEKAFERAELTVPKTGEASA